VLLDVVEYIIADFEPLLVNSFTESLLMEKLVRHHNTRNTTPPLLPLLLLLLLRLLIQMLLV